jgi:polyhydroxybutyrate depolymerase
MTWAPVAPADCSVVLYRIEGGGHGWPGGKQYLPARLIGRIPQHLDATTMVLDFARAAIELTAVR